MANVNVVLNSASIQVLDLTTNLFRINSPVGTITLAATAAFYEPYFQAAAGPGSGLSMPTSTLFVVYVKNLSATNNIQVQFTAIGGAQITAAQSPLLLPGGAFIYWNTVETSGGIVILTLIGSAANTPAEVLLAG